MNEGKMQAIEVEAKIDENGHIYLPAKYQNVYGRNARLLVLLPDQPESQKKKRKPGSAKGILNVLCEDELHLEDFKEYM